jgi:hypothetical protein
MGTDEDEDEDADEDDDDDEDGDEDEDAPAVLRACACVFVYNSGGRSVMHTFESLERNAAPKRDALNNPPKSPWPDSSGAEACLGIQKMSSGSSLISHDVWQRLTIRFFICQGLQGTTSCQTPGGHIRVMAVLGHQLNGLHGFRSRC